MELPKFVTDPNPEIYLSDNYVTVDFETTTENKGSALNPNNRIVLAVWKYNGELKIRRAGEYELSELVEDIRSADFLVAQNAKFELQWLERCGLDLTDIIIYDTMIGEYVIGGNRWVFSQLSLDRIAQRRGFGGKLGSVHKMIKGDVPVEDMPESWLEKYCVQDVKLTEKIFLDQRRELVSKNLLPVCYTRCLLTPVLADIEKNGMYLDPDIVVARAKDTEKKYAQICAELDEITGGVNLNSRKQLGEYLYETLGLKPLRIKRGGAWIDDKTPSGDYKVDADTILALKAWTKEQKRFIAKFKESKELYNELTKYLRKFAECCADTGGHLLASFNQTSTQTHRLSSTGARYATQLHNIPRAYKSFFYARHEGWCVGECDGSQLEFRVAGHLGRDDTALYDITHGVDVHHVTASVIWPDEIPEEGKHPKRQDAKPKTFKPLYGGQSGTEEEKRYYKFFREKYEGISQTQKRWIDEVLENKYLVTEWGLRYYWPNTKMDRSGYITNTTSICNYPVQAFATAEIIPIALVWFWHRVKAEGLRMLIVNTVHDSIIVEMPQEEIDTFHRLSKQCLIDDVYYSLRRLYECDFTVPLGAGVKVGTHWNGSDCADYVPAGLVHDKGEVTYTAPEELWKSVNK